MMRGLTVMVPSLAVPDGANDDEASSCQDENSEGPSDGAFDRAGDCSNRIAGPSLEEAPPG